MITVGQCYMMDGKEVVVEDGDIVEQLWIVRVVSTGKLLYGVLTSQLCPLQGGR